MSVASVTAVLAMAGCGTFGSSPEHEGLAVRLVNTSASDALIVGCPPCGKDGVRVVGDPGPGSGGAYLGWDEKRAWPVTYRVVVDGVESICPFIDPEPGKGTIGIRDIVYVVTPVGRCAAGPTTMDAL
ncbi:MULTISPECIES: hypothetical protein [unclassified Streptomyces]|uniref:hypothetical protein n=1 Tax=unclassified Streptomyces TaxID=2593676 RepID=UPI00136BA7CE|nr:MULTISPECIES: hypothetical protein [unclassified Streptomyces]MYT73393.1 hypothetical protein [Streptomyces sp. SID8367]